MWNRKEEKTIHANIFSYKYLSLDQSWAWAETEDQIGIWEGGEHFKLNERLKFWYQVIFDFLESENKFVY